MPQTDIALGNVSFFAVRRRFMMSYVSHNKMEDGWSIGDNAVLVLISNERRVKLPFLA